MPEPRCYPARGLSMLPSIYPRDLLHVESVRPADLVPGDLVAYPIHGGQLACHRVLTLERRGAVLWLEVRGDAQVGSEWIAEDAVAFRVTRVQGRLGSWRVDGPRGRFWVRLALSSHPLMQLLRKSAARALRSYALRGRAGGAG